MTPTLGRRTMFMFIAAGLFTACGSIRTPERPPDEQYGHRYEGRATDGRETIVITTPDEGIEYVYYPATYDTVHIRQAAPASPTDESTRIEVLVKGAFPDACTELHSVAQERAEHILNVTLEMRRPRGILCASVVRPYRFYVELEGLYEPGHYSLRVNNTSHPFVVAPFDR